MMVDLNYPCINWLSLHSPVMFEQQFVECLEDCFFMQLVRDKTRKQKSMLDLVITGEPDIVDDVEVLDTFGKSDHHMLSWRSDICVESGIQMQILLDYNKADFRSIAREYP